VGLGYNADSNLSGINWFCGKYLILLVPATGFEPVTP
jgi:hypothetical protein